MGGGGTLTNIHTHTKHTCLLTNIWLFVSKFNWIVQRIQGDTPGRSLQAWRKADRGSRVEAFKGDDNKVCVWLKQKKAYSVLMRGGMTWWGRKGKGRRCWCGGKVLGVTYRKNNACSLQQPWGEKTWSVSCSEWSFWVMSCYSKWPAKH